MLYAEHLLKRDRLKRLFSVAHSARGVMPFKVTSDPLTDGDLPLVVPTFPNRRPFSLRAPNYDAGKSVFEGVEWSFSDQTDTTAASNVLILLDQMNGRNYMNQPVHIRTFAGTGRLPAVMLEPLVMHANAKLDGRLQMAATGQGPASIRPYLGGAVYWPKYFADTPEIAELARRLRKRLTYFSPYWLTTETPVSLTSLQNNVQFDIRIGRNMEIFAMAAIADGNFAVEFSEVRSNQTLMNGRISQTAGIGDARFPTIFDVPWLLPGGSILRLAFENLLADTNKVFLTFWCRMIYGDLSQLEIMERETDIDMPLRALEAQLVGAA